MAHVQQQEYCRSIQKKYESFFKNKYVLDIGSLDINGNNQEYFENCNYLGVDIAEGKNVDVTSKGHELGFPDGTFDVVISTECFEHDQYYDKTIKNIYRMLKPGGLFIFSCATTGRPEHGTRRTTPEQKYQVIESNAISQIKNIYYFETKDPQMFISIGNDNLESVLIDIEYIAIKGDKSRSLDSFFQLLRQKSLEIDNLNQDVTQKSEQIETLNEDVTQKSEQIETLNEDVTQKSEQIETLNEDVTQKSEQIETLNEDVSQKSQEIILVQDELTKFYTSRSNELMRFITKITRNVKR